LDVILEFVATATKTFNLRLASRKST